MSPMNGSFTAELAKQSCSVRTALSWQIKYEKETDGFSPSVFPFVEKVKILWYIFLKSIPYVLIKKGANIMDFTVNFMQSTSNVWKEAIKLKKYKAMPLGLAIPTGVLMLPVALVSLIAAVLIYVLGYLFSVVLLPTQRLYKLLHEEGQTVKHASQFIMYFLSWGFIFSAYAALSLFMIILTVLYTIFSILAYLATLGGFKFHVFAKEEDISVDVEGKYPIWMPIAFIAAMGVLILILPLIKTIGIAADFPKKMEGAFKLFMQIYWARILNPNFWRFLFSAVYSAVIFAPFPKKKEEE